jgi:hypothetical protein
LDRKAKGYFVIFVISLGMLLSSCAAPGTSQPTPGIEETPITSISAEVTVTPLPKGQAVSSDAYVILFRNVVAGDYSLLSLNATGGTELIGWNRLNQITVHRNGEIGMNDAHEFFQTLTSAEFQGLEQQYDIYPLPENSTLVYEDIYYILRFHSGGIDKTVLAHEQAIPPAMRTALSALQRFADQMQGTDLQGNFILSGDHEVLGYKRFIKTENLLQLDDEQAVQYPLLMDAINHPFSLIPAKDLITTKLGDVLNEEKRSLEIVYKRKHFDVLFLVDQ